MDPDSSAVLLSPGTAALVLDSPHSGSDYPEDFRPACSFEALRSAEDSFVDELWGFADRLDVPLLSATFPRSYIDANRSLQDIDPALLDQPWPGPIEDSAKVRLGKGLVWRLLDDGMRIYDRRLGIAELAGRIDRCWRPYHEALARLIGDCQRRHGHVIHLIFLASFTGPQQAALDVLSSDVTFDAANNRFLLHARTAGAIAGAEGVAFVFGFDRGGAANSPFGAIGHPGVAFNATATLRSNGTGNVGANAISVNIVGNDIFATVLADLLPSNGAAVTEYEWALWSIDSRIAGLARNADFAPGVNTQVDTLARYFGLESLAWVAGIGPTVIRPVSVSTARRLCMTSSISSRRSL